VTRRRWLLTIAAGGLGIFALSFVGGWLIHDREVLGEGYRSAQVALSAWRGPAVPVLTLAVITGVAVGGWAAVAAWRPTLPRWPLVWGSVVVLGLLLATAAPISQAGHASRVDLSAGPLLALGIAVATLMVVAAIAAEPPRGRVLAAAVAAGLLLMAGGAGGRWIGLQTAEGSGRHWSEGTYTRAATGGERTETLSIGDGTFTIADRWSGTWEWSGWTVSLDGDPACPDARGTYHAHGTDDDGLRFVKIVDTCGDGARAADLETGIWERDG
jgi:hypothetical protein